MDEIFENDEENLKGYCKCNNCVVENKWLKLTNNKKNIYCSKYIQTSKW